jgi:hypothetical protein
MATIEHTEYKKNPRKFLANKRAEMAEAVKNLDFETAALIRDEIYALSGQASPGKPKKIFSYRAWLDYCYVPHGRYWRLSKIRLYIRAAPLADF